MEVVRAEVGCMALLCEGRRLARGSRSPRRFDSRDVRRWMVAAGIVAGDDGVLLISTFTAFEGQSPRECSGRDLSSLSVGFCRVGMLLQSAHAIIYGSTG